MKTHRKYNTNNHSNIDRLSYIGTTRVYSVSPVFGISFLVGVGCKSLMAEGRVHTHTHTHTLKHTQRGVSVLDCSADKKAVRAVEDSAAGEREAGLHAGPWTGTS